MAGGGEGSEFEVNINLTALLDVLTNLLFFLLIGFAAQQSSIEIEPGLDLPGSSSEAPPKTGPTITIARAELRMDKERLAPLRGGNVGGSPPGQRIEVLYRRLVRLKTERGSRTLAKDDALLVMCDKDASYQLLHQVLNTAAEAGYPKFRMAVLLE